MITSIMPGVSAALDAAGTIQVQAPVSSGPAAPLDYSPLEQKVGLRQRLSAKHGFWISVLAGITGLLGIFSVIILLLSPSPTSVGIFSILLTILIALTVAAYVHIGKTLRLSLFATTNSLGYASNMPVVGGSGMIFRQVMGGKYTDILTATNRNFAEIGNYEYVIESGSGENRNRTTHDYGFVRIKLPRRLPNMLLDSKKNNFLGMSNLPETFSKAERIELEGNFGEHFTLYAPPEYKTDAFYIFTPDVMQALIDAVHSYDCEVIDDDFYIYSSKKFALDKRSDLEDIMRIIDTVSPELAFQSKRYADERIGDFAANVVAEPGRRLKQRTPWVLILLFLVVFAVIASFGPLGAFLSGLFR